MDQRNSAVNAISGFSHSGAVGDEIDLVDLAVILVRHWRVMLAVSLLTGAGGISFAWLKDTKYQYSTVIAIGQRADGQLLDTPEAVQAAINNIFLPAAAGSADKEIRQLAGNTRIELPRGSNAVVLKIKASKKKADSIDQLFSLISAPLIADHNKRFERLSGPLNKQVVRQEAVLVALSQDVAKLQAELSGAGQDTRILLLDRIGRLQESYRLAQQELSQLQADIARTTSTYVSSAPQRSLSEADTSPLLISVLAAALGGMLAVFSAFFAEFASRVRARLRASPAAPNARQPEL